MSLCKVFVYKVFLYTKYLYEYIDKDFCVNMKIAHITIQMIVNFHQEGEHDGVRQYINLNSFKHLNLFKHKLHEIIGNFSARRRA